LAAVKAGFRVAHVEAGLRAFDMSMPEEINRRVVDHISHHLFAPTPSAVRNLQEERVLGRVFLTGDLHVATLKRWLPIAEERSRVLERLGLGGVRYAVVTLHRAENVDNVERLRKLFLVRSLAEYLPVVFPMHPRTLRRVQEAGLQHLLSLYGVVVTNLLGYIDFVKLLNHSEMVLTDSDGVQRGLIYCVGRLCC
jgi:UDP-N-acetylglucosamine 2-epimerase (non-hydrolysing)